VPFPDSHMAGKGGGPTGHRLFVANLPYSVDWKYLKDLFRDAGVDVRRADILEDGRTGRSKGNGLVEVGSPEDMDRAIEALNEVEVDGRNIIVREDREPDKGLPKGKGKGKLDRDDRDFREHSKGDGKGKGRPTWHGALPDEPRPSGRYDYERRGRPEREEARDDRRGQPGSRDFQEPAGGCFSIEGLPPGYPWQGVKDLCRSVGIRVKHVDVVDAGRDESVAFVEVFDAPDVWVAVDTLGGTDVDGRRLLVRPEPDEGARDGGGRGAYVPPDDGRGGPHWDRGGRREGHGGKGPGKVEEWGDRRRGGKGKDRAPPEEPPPRGRRPAEPDEDVCRLFAENLAPSVDWRQLKDMFKGYHNVLYADVVHVGAESFGIIEFQTRVDAMEACMEFNGVLIEDMAIRLRQDRGEFHELRASKRQRTSAPEVFPEHDERPKAREAYDAPEGDGQRRGGGRFPSGPRVFVGNLDFAITWQNLKDHMRQAGNVRFCDVLKDPSGRPKGCGIVEFTTEEECETALATLNDTELGSRAIYVRWAEERGAGPRR